MFGRQKTIAGNSAGIGSNLVEFRAGRMHMIGKIVHPDTRKGLVYLKKCEEDGLVHFYWKDRTTGEVEENSILFPNDSEFTRVDQCKTGRVYVLKFKSSSRRLFFWLQEPREDKDEEYCNRVNELINNPSLATYHRQARGVPDLQRMLGNQQLRDGAGGMNYVESSGNSSRNTSTLGNNSTFAYNNLITPETVGMPAANKGEGRKGSTNGKGGGANNAANSTETNRSVKVDLCTAVVCSEEINQIISDPERVNLLAAHLPETHNVDGDKKQQIKDTIASPQFKQALAHFCDSLQTAQLGPVVSQFELTPEAVEAAYSGNLEDFVKALGKNSAAAKEEKKKQEDQTKKGAE